MLREHFRDRFFIIIAIFIVVYLLISIFSIGFYHPDEHFQIIELMNLKFGGITEKELFWDFHLEMRPFVQPFLYYLIASTFKFFNLSNPFFLSFVFRLLSSFLGLFSIMYLIKQIGFSKESDKLRYLLFIPLLWFVPFILVRTSSESLSSSLFILSIAILVKNGADIFNNKQAREIKFSLIRVFSLGVLLGLSFFIRFQMGFSVFFLFLWLLLIGKTKFISLMYGVLGIVFSIGICFLIDRWGYNLFTFTPWNYFRENLLHNRVSDFGVLPWWGYFKLIAVKGIPPISILFLFCTLIFWLKNIKSLTTFITLPFFIIHCFIGHKELRFLNFIYILSPFIVVYLINKYRDHFGFWLKKIWQVVFLASLSVNFVLLIFVIFRPAHTPLKFYKYLYDNFRDEVTINVTAEGAKRYPNLQLNFYSRDNVSLKNIANNAMGTDQGLYFTTRYTEYSKIVDMKNCGILFSSYPAWVLKNNFFGWRDRSSIWTLFKCE